MSARLLKILGSKYPIMLGPMRFITLGEMAGLVSKHGGFGQIAASGLEPAQLRKEIAKARSITQLPIGVNFPVYRPKTEALIDVAIDQGIHTITTSAGHPGKFIQKIKSSGMHVLHKISTVEMGKKAEDEGVDGIIATGIEAGGHVGRNGTTTLCLIPQLTKCLDLPIIAAGGIGSRRQYLAAQELGAEGVEMGTRFLASVECPISDFYKQMVLEAKDDDQPLIDRQIESRGAKSSPPRPPSTG